VSIDDLLIPASEDISEAQLAEFKHFDLRETVQYQASYLADWPAETYQLSLSRAALEAREQAFKSLKPSVSRVAGVFEPVMSSAAMTILSFKLVLLPIWVSHFEHRGERYEVVVNGQTGHVGDKLSKPERGWLDRFVNSL
jgi:hypothetical protein